MRFSGTHEKKLTHDEIFRTHDEIFRTNDEIFWTHETHEGTNLRRNILDPRGNETHAI